MMKDVPLVGMECDWCDCLSHHTLPPVTSLTLLLSQLGWDVAFTSEGICLLEVNLSCNFFRGTFDKAVYFEFINSYWTMLEGKEAGEKVFRRNPESVGDKKIN